MVKVASLFSQINSAPLPPRGVRRPGQETRVRKERQGLHFLGPLRRHGLLPARRRVAPRDHRRLQSCLGKLRHLVITRPVTRSTLSYANKQRPAQVLEELFWASLKHFPNNGGFENPKHKFRFNNQLLSFDATVISLCLKLFPWAKFRRAKGGVKVNVLLDHVELPSMEMVPVSANARDPVGAMIRERSSGNGALECLARPADLPRLRQALAATKDPNWRKELETVIRGLESSPNRKPQ